MEKSSRVRDIVPSIQHISFNVLDAFESLHAYLVKIEALASVACELADRLQPPSTRERKRELIRMQLFVGQTAREAGEAVAHGDRLMASLKRLSREP